MPLTRKPEHQLIRDALLLMDGKWLMERRCWFGGGTAIVLLLEEYRRSLDIDFLCSDVDGYRALRSAAVEKGVRAFFREPVEAVRDVRVDQYGIRAIARLRGQPFKFEVVRESRISVAGEMDPSLQVPTLTYSDMFAEKLLANADRCQDPSVACRDAIDLGMLLGKYRVIPPDAVAKSVAAYGQDIGTKLAWVLKHLKSEEELRNVAQILVMNQTIAREAVERLRANAADIWPNAGISISRDGAK